MNDLSHVLIRQQLEHAAPHPLGALPTVLALVMTLILQSQSLAATISKAAYQDRLRAMWLAQNVANWTGLTTEGARSEAPFLRDGDWHSLSGRGRPVAFVDERKEVYQYIDFIFKDPWPADDDTDIEYTYLMGMEKFGTPYLTPEQIRIIWQTHINRFIWASNARARALMDRRVFPPATGMLVANNQAMMIDAQLTTEFFGALAPMRPDVALRMADLPIRTTAAGHAAHAAQFCVAMYSLAPQANPDLPRDQQIRWLINEARRYLPDSSKASDIIDFVLTEYDTNPDKDDWESTRDNLYQRYQANAVQNGYVYDMWYDSLINLGALLTSLVYGEGDLAKSIRIGTLTGWDSDNGTATVAGLLGLMFGSDYVHKSFPGHELSDRYQPSRTRDLIAICRPGDPLATDSFTRMAARMMPFVERAVVDSGGHVSSDAFEVTPFAGQPREASVTWLLHGASSNLSLVAAGQKVRAQVSQPSSPTSGYGSGSIGAICDGVEHDYSGRQMYHSSEAPTYWSNQGSPTSSLSATVQYSQPVEVRTVRFIEGDHFVPVERDVVGGWFEEVTIELLIGDVWKELPEATTCSQTLDRNSPFQIVDFVLPSSVHASGVRLSGKPGGRHQFATIAELDTLSVEGNRPQLKKPSGSLVVDHSPPPSKVNLSREGTLDWIQWGEQGLEPRTDGQMNGPARYVRKSGVPEQLSSIVNMGGAVVQGEGFPTVLEWNDGVPLNKSEGVTSGVWHQNGNPRNMKMSDRHGMIVTAPADENERQLRLYIGATNIKALLTATLSDGSAADYAEEIPSQIDDYQVYTFKYKAGGDHQTLSIRLRAEEPLEASAKHPFRLKLQAATLSGALSAVPTVAIRQPTSQTTIMPGENLTIHASAAVAKGRIDKVAFYCGQQFLGQDKTEPFQIEWQNIPQGTHRLAAQAFCGDNRVRSSVVPVIAEGGELRAKFESPSRNSMDLSVLGALDWIHWGGTAEGETQINRKRDAACELLGYEILHKLAPEIEVKSHTQFDFSWADGVPLSRPASVSGYHSAGGYNSVTAGQNVAFKLTAPAETEARELCLWVCSADATGVLQAYLSDGSAPTYVNTELVATESDRNPAGMYRFRYRASKSGQKLYVIFGMQSHRYQGHLAFHGGIGIAAAALSAISEDDRTERGKD